MKATRKYLLDLSVSQCRNLFFPAVEIQRSSSTIFIPFVTFFPLSIIQYIFHTFSFHVVSHMILYFPPGFTFILPTSRSIISHSGMTATVIKYPAIVTPSIFHWILNLNPRCICAINCISNHSLLSLYSKKSLAYFCIQGFNAFALSCSTYTFQQL